MKGGLALGKSRQENLIVDKNVLAKTPVAFGGASIHDLLGTAPLIEALEWTSRQLILPYLEADEEAVGAAIELRHLAGVPIGETVLLESTVLELSEHRIKTRIQAHCRDKLVADGTFVQALVPRVRLQAVSLDALSNVSQETVSPELVSMDGRYGLTIDLLGWESLFPCTPYDEWINARLALRVPSAEQAADGIKRVEAPCLLRFEVEAIAEALQRLLPLETQAAGFQSDFLEPTLKLSMRVDGRGHLLLGVIVEEQGKSDTNEVVFPLSKTNAQRWCDFTKNRLAELQALL
ncbi:MAG: hypothetical protein VKJ04_03300 [Vampirovibrionales bacterium]|nr:hypothetical protein [Vampirovibrionales bacterium]